MGLISAGLIAPMPHEDNMRKAIVLVLGLLVGTSVVADELIVTRDGRSLAAIGARKDGERIVYNDKDSGDEKQLPASGVDAIVPIVQRGKAYKPEEVQRTVDLLKALKGRHQGLLRQLNEILQAWQALQRATPEFEGQITNLVSVFEASDKMPAIYKKTVLDLSMIKFKDVQGMYTPRIDAACESMRKEFVATNLDRLVKMAAGDKIPAERFVPLKRLAEPLSEAADAGDREKIKALVEKSRLTALDTTCRQAESVFVAAKSSVDAYLKSAGLLFLARREVAATAEQKAGIEKKLAALRSAAGRSLPACRLDENGFPISIEEIENR